MHKSIRKITLTALLAALAFISFSFFQIKVQTPVGPTSFHLGNSICVIAGVLLGPIYGGLAGAIGMGIGDLLDPAYIQTAFKTILLKFALGYIAGYLSKYIFKLDNHKKRFRNILLIVLITMFSNIILEPVVSYLYYNFLLGNSAKAVNYLLITRWITTTINAILSGIVSTIILMTFKNIKE